MAATFMDQGTAVRWFTDADIPADMEAITVAEWEAGADIADQLVVGSSSFQFTDPDTTDEKTYKDKGKVQQPTYDNYEGNATMRRDRDATGLLLPADPLTVFEHRSVGYIALRPGQPEDEAVAAGQDYVYFKFMVTKRNPITVPNAETEKIEVGFLPQGDSGHGVLDAT